MGVGDGDEIEISLKPKTSLLGKLDLKSMLSSSKGKKDTAKAPAAA